MSRARRSNPAPWPCSTPVLPRSLEGEVTLPAIACSELLAFGPRENALFEISFGGPNITTPTSIAAPGIAVKTQHLRSNENGVLALTLDNGHSARLRFKQD
jgi:hypothetical protein